MFFSFSCISLLCQKVVFELKGCFCNTLTVVDIRIVFKLALEHNATSIILSHNHPSGKLQASEADIQITKKMKEAGKNLDIQVLDHVIITEKSYYSFVDEGIF